MVVDAGEDASCQVMAFVAARLTGVLRKESKLIYQKVGPYLALLHIRGLHKVFNRCYLQIEHL